MGKKWKSAWMREGKWYLMGESTADIGKMFTYSMFNSGVFRLNYLLVFTFSRI